MSTASQHVFNPAARAARAEAAVWMVRLHGEQRTPELEAGLREWLAADPENARQFEHIADVWEAGGAVTADGLPRMRSWSVTNSRLRWVLASAAVLACAMLFIALRLPWKESTYETEHGEQRLVRLQDGSSVYLNSDSRMHVEFSAKVRLVSLDRGEGLFEIAHDPRHPFVVQAGERQVTALGTTFVVRYEPTRTAITLVEGKIVVSGAVVPDARKHEPASADVDPASRPERAPAGAALVTLSPGERLVLSSDAAPRLDSPRIDAVTAWRRGQVLLEATALPEAIAEMNRYDRRQLVIDDPELDAVRVSGVYQTGDSLGFARAVAELREFELTEKSDAIHLHLRHPQENAE